MRQVYTHLSFETAASTIRFVKIVFFLTILMTIYDSTGQTNPNIDSLLVVLKNSRQDTSTVNNLNDLSRLYRQESEIEIAMQYADSALELAGQLKYLKGQADACNNMGVIHANQGDYPAGLRSFMAALRIREELGDKQGIANSYNNIGTIYESQGDYAKALNYHKLSLMIKEEIGDKKGMAGSFNNIGMIYDNQGMYEEALENYYISLKINEEIGNRFRMAGNYINIGVAHMYQDKYPEALENFTQAMAIAREIGAEEMYATLYTNLGRVNMQLGRFDPARTHLETALDHVRGTGNQYEMMAIYETLYTLDSTQGRWREAFDHYLLYTAIGDSLFNVESEYQIAQIQVQYETEKKDKEIELLNKESEIKTLQLSRHKAIRHGMIAGIILLIITGFLVFRSFRLRKKLEQQQAIISERKRISADLHDDVGSGLSRIMLLTELVKNEARTPEMHREAEKIAGISKELSGNISEIIWALNANNDTLEGLVAYIRRYAGEYFENSIIQLRISIPAEIPNIPISGEKRRDIFYTVKEALHNIVKHSGAKEAELNIVIREGALAVTILDNGRGIPKENAGTNGNGLHNMRDRTEAVGGRFNIENQGGTKITIEVPLL